MHWLLRYIASFHDALVVLPRKPSAPREIEQDRSVGGGGGAIYVLQSDSGGRHTKRSLQRTHVEKLLRAECCSSDTVREE